MTHDEMIMRLALTEAQKAYDCGETPVGAVLTWDGEPIVQTHNLRETEKLATAHAELLAIEQACKKTGRMAAAPRRAFRHVGALSDVRRSDHQRPDSAGRFCCQG